MMLNMQIRKWIRAIGLLLLSMFMCGILTFPAFAEADLTQGAKIFKANCIGCHMGGKNSVMPDKNLYLQTLQKYSMDSQEAVIKQVTYGKGGMPAFGKRLKPEEIDSVAAYVLDQAQRNWGKNLANLRENSVLLACADD
ncbi:MAG: c-type cytochrome [Cyanobacteriota bacterium]|nr:c-type cytochrome [Cyanobacteriota bacterium]